MNIASTFLRCTRHAAIIATLLTVSACTMPTLPDTQDAGALPLVIGHRGASGHRPEHTLAAYQLAIEQGADFIEPDLVMTADGVIVARHENEIGGTTNVARIARFADRRARRTVDGEVVTGWFTEDFTLAELKTLRARERIPRLRPANTQYDGRFEVPTLDEILELVRTTNRARAGRGDPPVGLYLEIKHSSYFRARGLPIEEPLVDALHRAGYDREDSPVILQSFETGNLRHLAALTRLRRMQLIAAEGAPWDFIESGDARTYADLVTDAGLDDIATYAHGIGANKELLLPQREDGTRAAATTLTQDAHARGLCVHVWTFRLENTFLPQDLRSSDQPAAPGNLVGEVARHLALGVDGVFADHPAIARQALQGLPSTAWPGQHRCRRAAR